MIGRLEVVLHELWQLARDGWAPVDVADWQDLPLLDDWQVRRGLLEGPVAVPPAETDRADRTELYHCEPLILIVPEWAAALTTVRRYRLGKHAADEALEMLVRALDVPPDPGDELKRSENL